MIFVTTNDLKKGMRLAKPVYNKNGVLLYGRDTKLTEQGIVSIKNFSLIGIYVLEPAEPLPPMSEDDIEFERFQTMAVFSIKDDMKALLARKVPPNLNRLTDMIINNYGGGDKKISFTQNLRSPSDYVYKHSLNVAILAALISGQIKESLEEQREIVIAALLHDIGKLTIRDTIACKDDPDEEEQDIIKRGIMDGYNLLEYSEITASTKRMITQFQKEVYDLNGNTNEETDKTLSLATGILMIADEYDKLTAMKIDESPMSEIAVLKRLMADETYSDRLVNALTDSINIVVPGVCLELTNGEKGLVIRENQDNLLQPVVLGFDKNIVYDLEKTGDAVQIKDIMKTMDNRIIIDKERLEEYSNMPIHS